MQVRFLIADTHAHTHTQEAARAARMRASGLISEDAFAEEAAAREAMADEGDAAAAAAADPAVAERQYQVQSNPFFTSFTAFLDLLLGVYVEQA